MTDTATTQSIEKYKTVNIQNLPPSKERRHINKPRSIGDRLTKCHHYSYDKKKCGCNILYAIENNTATLEGHQNGFFSAFLNAYNYHEDIILSPDDIWLLVRIHFSKYINVHAEKMRDKFVSHQDKMKLTVVTGNQTDESEWDEFMTGILVAIKQNTKDNITDLLKCDFSTTGPVENIISTVCIMDSFKKYFDYGRCIPCCGINNVKFMGTLVDWQKLLTKITDLKKYGVTKGWDSYINELLPIIEKLIDTYNGKVDVAFWNKIMNIRFESQGSGSTSVVSGWILKFFGLKNEVETDDIPEYKFDVPVEIDNKLTGIKKMVSLVGGFIGVYKEGTAYRPTLGMAVYHDGNINGVAAPAVEQSY
jgi:hypothetical protein